MSASIPSKEPDFHQSSTPFLAVCHRKIAGVPYEIKIALDPEANKGIVNQSQLEQLVSKITETIQTLGEDCQTEVGMKDAILWIGLSDSGKAQISVQNEELSPLLDAAQKASRQYELLIQPSEENPGAIRRSQTMPQIELPEKSDSLRNSKSSPSLSTSASKKSDDNLKPAHTDPLLSPRPRSKSATMPNGLQKMHKTIKELPIKRRKSPELKTRHFEQALQDLKAILGDKNVGLLSPRGETQDISVDTLILEFLKLPKGIHTITSEEGRGIIQNYLNEIITRFQDAYPSATSQLAKGLWKAESSEEEVAHTIQKIIEMNQNGKKLPSAMEEWFSTEMKFNYRLHLLFDKNWDGSSFFEMLKNKGLIDAPTEKLLSDGWEELSLKSEQFMRQLAIFSDKTANPTTKLEALLHYIKSNELKAYFSALEILAQKYAQMDDAFDTVTKTHSDEWKEIRSQFIKAASGDSIEDPKSILAEPFQRVGRLPLLMQEIIKNGTFLPQNKIEELHSALGALKLYSDNINSSL